MTVQQAESMQKVVSEEEIKCILFAMKNKKAPGADGYTAEFFKSAWNVVGVDVIAAIKHFFATGKLLK